MITARTSEEMDATTLTRSLQAIQKATEKLDTLNPQEKKLKDIFSKAQEQELAFKTFEEETSIIKCRSEITWSKICISIGSLILGRKYQKRPNLDHLAHLFESGSILGIESQRLSGTMDLPTIYTKDHRQKAALLQNNAAGIAVNLEDILYDPSAINHSVDYKAWETAIKNVGHMEIIGRIAIKIACVTSVIGLGTLAYFQYKKV